MRRWLKAFGIAVIGRADGVHRRRKGQIVFNKAKHWLIWIVSPFYDVRQTRSGRVFFQMRDPRAERKAIKRMINRLRKQVGRSNA